MPHPSLTQQQMETACTEWQKRLRLQDWDITIKIERFRDLEPQGNCIVTQGLKYALIRVLDGIDQPENPTVVNYDMEAVLLHELLHIHFDMVMRDYDTNTIRTNPGKDSTGETIQSIALEQAFCGLVPWMMSVGRVIPLED